MAKLKLASRQALQLGGPHADIAKVQDKYGAIGYVKADVAATCAISIIPDRSISSTTSAKATATASDASCIEIKGENPHTQITTVLNRLSFQPGDIIDMREVRQSSAG